LNLLALTSAVFGLAIDGPVSLRAQFEDDVDRGLARAVTGAPIRDADLEALPAPVQRYLRTAGVVGMPRPQNVFVRMHGRIRSGADAAWMPFVAEQYNFFDQPSRFFYMELTDGPWAVQGFHRYAGPLADMRVNVAGLVPVARAGGEDMTVSETVTMLNDMAMLAPATLVSPAIAWERLGACSTRASFENAMMRVHATLEVNDAGELVNFVSDDRRQLAGDGTFRPMRWRTPLGGYRSFGSIRLASRGEARWEGPDGGYSYIEIEIEDVRYDVRTRERRR
jgi:hypothetical protein